MSAGTSWIGRRLTTLAASEGDAPGFVVDWAGGGARTPETVGWRRIEAEVAGVAAAMAGCGVRPGGRIAIIGDPGPKLLTGLLAAAWLDAVVAPFSPHWPSELAARRLGRFGAELLFFLPGAAVPAGCPCPAVPVPAAAAGGVAPCGFSAPCGGTACFTSGSSGDAKIVFHSWEAHRISAASVGAHLGVTSADRWLLTLPLCHVGGLAILWRCLWSGASVVVPSGRGLGGGLAPERLGLLGVTRLSVVAAQLGRLVAAQPAGAGTGLRSVVHGGGPLPPGLLAVAGHLPLVLSYGSTESASMVAATTPGETLRDPCSAGRPLGHCDVAVVDGEIRLRGGSLGSGYLTAGGMLPLPLVGGWFRTGDSGCLRDGTLRVIGRLDGMFICGGENVHPEQVERAILRLPGVRGARVVPVPDAEFGQRPVAFVDAEGLAPTPLRELLRARLPRHMVPVRILPMPPRPAGGLKHSRAALQARAAGTVPCEPGSASDGAEVCWHVGCPARRG